LIEEVKMSLWIILFLVFLAGSTGGIVNAMLSHNGFVLPRREKIESAQVIRPGFLGNILVGGIASSVSWGLYGPLSSFYLVGGSPAFINQPSPGLTLSGFFGALMVGIIGARWLTNEVDKRLLKATVSQVAATGKKSQLANRIYQLHPAASLHLAVKEKEVPNEL
jgi:hypothetical protein